jgi:hypothetical protein
MKALLPVLALAALSSMAATLAATDRGHESDRILVRASTTGTFDRAISAKVCVTRQALCLAGGGQRSGDPCSCPHPLRGSMPGYVDQAGGTSERPPQARGWPEADGPDPLARLENALLDP